MSKKTEKTLVSVIIPVHDSLEYLRKSLPATRDSEYPNLEVLVVDDFSSDNVFDYAKELADKTLRLSERGGPAKARNLGCEHADGEILFFLDADVVIKPDTISKALKAFEGDPSVVAVFGSYDTSHDPGDFFSQYKNLFHHFIHQNSEVDAKTFWSGCGAVRKKTFFEHGGFPETHKHPAIEDVELGYKISAVSKISLLKDMQVTHLKEWSFSSIIKTDVFQRTMPWTHLSLDAGLPKDLNFKTSSRLSALLCLIIYPTLALTLTYPPMAIITLLISIILIVLNASLYLFFLRMRGLFFTLRAVLFHWFYYSYSSIAYIVFFAYFKIARKLGYK